MVGYLAKLLLGNYFKLPAMWTASLSPMLIEFSTEARPYAIMAFWGTAFIICLVIFVKNESWKNAALLGIVSAMGCFSRTIFAANLIFGVIYYLYKRKNITKYASVAFLIVTPVLIYTIFLLFNYEAIAPQVQEGTNEVSTINFILRYVLVFNFGYNIFFLPELEFTRNVPLYNTVKNNWQIIIPMVIAGFGILVGLIHFAKRDNKTFFFLLFYIILPSVLIIVAGQLGYTILREKFLIGGLGGYVVLLSAVFKELIQKKLGWVPIVCFTSVVGISLYHYFVLPEIYSRREMHSALNCVILKQADKNDTIVIYNIPLTKKEFGPHYYSFIEAGYNYIDLASDISDGMTIKQYARQIDQKTKNRIFLISRETMRNFLDPKNIVFKEFASRREWIKRRFGRNLSLYIFH
jgi:hypothetical protein